MPLFTGKSKPALGFSRRFFLSSLVAATCLLGAAIPASADTVAQADPSLGNYWPKFDGIYVRLKDGGLIEVPKLESMTWDKDADIFYEFRDHNKGRVNGLILNPDEVAARVPIIDGSQIEAFIFQNTTRFRSLTTLHKIGDYLNDRKGQNWSPAKRYHVMQSDGKEMALPADWPSLLIHSDWGYKKNLFRRERGPNGAVAYHLGNEDITQWINGRWMPGGWKEGDPRDVPVRAFVLESSRGRFLHRIFRIVQQPLN